MKVLQSVLVCSVILISTGLKAQVIRQSIGPISTISVQQDLTVFSCVGQSFQTQSINSDNLKVRPGFVQSPVVVDLTAPLSIEAFPNPVTSSINLDWGQASENTQIMIYDLNGALVFSKNINTNHSLKVDCSEWTSGMYVVQIIQAGSHRSLKFIKQ